MIQKGNFHNRAGRRRNRAPRDLQHDNRRPHDDTNPHAHRPPEQTARHERSLEESGFARVDSQMHCVFEAVHAGHGDVSYGVAFGFDGFFFLYWVCCFWGEEESEGVGGVVRELKLNFWFQLN